MIDGDWRHGPYTASPLTADSRYRFQPHIDDWKERGKNTSFHCPFLDCHRPLRRRSSFHFVVVVVVVLFRHLLCPFRRTILSFTKEKASKGIAHLFACEWSMKQVAMGSP